MKRLKLFFACLLMAVLSIGQVWATDVTIEKTMTQIVSANSYTVSANSDVTCYTSFALDGNITISTTGSANCGSFWGSSTQDWRLYQNKSGNVIITAADGCTLQKVTFTYSVSNTGTLKDGNTTIASNSEQTISGTTKTYTVGNTGTATNGQVRITKIKVIYTPAGGGTPAQDVSVTAVSLDKSQIALEVGEQKTLLATVSPDNATNKSVTWESDDTDVATVVNGLVTAVAEGTATITCKSEADATKFATCDVTVTAAEVPDLTFDFSAQGYENGVQYSSIDADANITITFGNGDNDGKYYNTGTAMRVYGGGHMTVAGGEGVTISKIVLVFGTGDGSNEISTNVATYDAGKWTGSEQSVTFNVGGSSGHRRIKVVKVFYEVAAVAVLKPTITAEDNNFLNTTTVTISHDDADAIYYTTNGDDPTVNNDLLYSAPFSLYNTATVKAIAVKGGVSSAVAEETFTKVTVMSVAEAKAAIAAAGTTPIENQYVEGVISQIDSYDGVHYSITYWISADGTTSNQLEVYSGKGLNGASFAGLSDLSLGDEVVVKGTLKNYKGTDEFDMNSHIIQLNRTIAAPTFNPNGGGFLNTLSVVITSATENAEVRYTIDGSDPTATSTLYENPIELSATTTIKAAAFQGEYVSAIVTKTFTKGSKITVAAALEALDSNSPIENQFVYGKVSTAPTSNPSSGRLTYYISDNGSTTDQLQVYNGYGLSGASFADKTDLQVGDEVTIYGTLKIFNEKKEFDAGNYLLEFNRPAVQTYSITYVENGANEDIADVEEATNLPDPLPTVTKNEKIFGGWFTTATFEAGSEAVAGAPLSKDETLYAKWNDLSQWAYTYTSNIALAVDENDTKAYAEKVKITVEEELTEFPALRAATGSAAGTCHVIVPAGTQTLHFHAAAWNNKTSTLTVKMGETTLLSQALTADAGINTNSPYTLEGNAYEYYYSIDLSSYNLTEETRITFSAASGKQSVIFGVNQEGGILPVLESIEIKGDLTTKTGYKAGDALDLDGLTVEATYSLGGVNQTPVDITNKLGDGLTLTYNPLVENQTEVTITATYGDKSDDITITGLEAVASADPKIYVQPSLAVNFGSIEVGEAVPTAQTITINLTNVASVTATLGGTNPEAFSISKTEGIVSGDEIIISVLANTDAAASYSATIAISDGADGATDKTVNLSFEVTDPVTPEDPEVRKTWDLSIASFDANPTEEQVTWSATYVNMVADKANSTTAANNYLGGDANNRTSSRFYKNSTLTITPNAKEITSVVFTATSASYANALQGSEWTNASASVDGTTVTVTPTDGKNAIIAVVGGTCGFTAVQVNYKNIAPAPSTPDYTRPVEINRYGTICLPNGGTIEGAKLYDLEYFDEGASTLFLLEVNGNAMVAGRPYVFLPSATTIEVTYTDDANETEGGSFHGLIGSLASDNVLIIPNAGNYILYENAYYLVNSTAYVGANRAYIHMEDVPTQPSTPGPAPRRRVGMTVHGEQTATGVDALNASETPVKMIIDGQMYILRGEKLYDATGRLVK